MTAERLRGLALGLVVAVTLAACSSDDGASPTTTTTVATTGSTTTAAAEPSTEPSTQPGDVLDDEIVPTSGLAGTVHRLRYASTDTVGEPIEVTGLVMTPDGTPPEGGWPILAWAHGTTGVGDDCALSPLGARTVPEVDALLTAGFAVAATDYEGLGSEGIHPYLVSESEARSVLDSVRALRNVFGAAVSDRVVLAGHSQGGHAALAAAELADAIAPELEVVGVAAFAPAADVSIIVPVMFDNTFAFALGMYVAAGWPDAHPELAAADLLNEDGLALVDRAATTCTLGLGGLLAGQDVADLRIARPTDVATWAARIAENTIHADRLDLPVMVLQGTDDQVIPKGLTDLFRGQLCSAGVPTRYVVNEGDDHTAIVAGGMSEMVAWATDRLADAPAPTDCV